MVAMPYRTPGAYAGLRLEFGGFTSNTYHVRPIYAPGETTIPNSKEPSVPLIWEEKTETERRIPYGLDLH
jgi:hypothetical protein